MDSCELSIYIKPYKHTRTPQKGRGFVTIMEDRWQTGDQVVLTNWQLLGLPGQGVGKSRRQHMGCCEARNVYHLLYTA